MKWAKVIAQNIVPEWKDHYISYKPLKKIIKKLKQALDNNNNESFIQLQRAFTELLQKDLDDVESFYISKEISLLTHINKLENKNKSIELYRLEKYAYVNGEGFRKILKKYDKKLSLNASNKYINIFATKTFYYHKKIQRLHAELSNNYKPVICKYYSSNISLLNPNEFDSKYNVALSQLDKFVNACLSKNLSTQLIGVTRIRQLLTTDINPPIQKVINSGVLPRIIQFLKSSSNKLVYESIWIVSNIAFGTAENTATVIRCGAVPILVELMCNPFRHIQEQAIWAIGNISGDSTKCRNLCLTYNVLNILKQICCCNTANAANKLSVLRTSSWLLSNLCRGKPSIDFKYFKVIVDIASKMLVTEKCKFNRNNKFNRLIYGFIHKHFANIPESLFVLILTYYPVSDKQILKDICWTFSYLTDFDDEYEYNNCSDKRIEIFIKSKSVMSLVDVLLYDYQQIIESDLETIRAIVRSIGNLVAISDNFVEKIIKYGVLNAFDKLLNANISNGIIKGICWTLSNIAATNSENIEILITENNNLVPKMINLMLESKYEIAKEATWIIRNMTIYGNDKHIKYLVNQNAIVALCQMLTLKKIGLLLCILEAMENILESGEKNNKDGNINKYSLIFEENEGIDLLEDLQFDDSIPDEIYEKSVMILKSYFDSGIEYEEQDETNDKQFTFTQFNDDDL